MKINYKIYPAFLSLFYMLNCSIDENLDLNLQDGAQKIVIEANVTDINGPYHVKVTKSQGASTSGNYYPVVSNAIVTLKDDKGQTEVLHYNESERDYETQNFTTHYGYTYTLIVAVDGTTYTATSKMPDVKVHMESLLQTNYTEGYIKYATLTPIFKNPVTKGNYYIFKSKEKDNVLKKKVFTFITDEYTVGQINNVPLDYQFIRGTQDYEAVVEMQSVDPVVYEFYKAYKQAIEEFGVITALNLKGNISNGALGYFSAHTTQVKQAVIPKNQ